MVRKRWLVTVGYGFVAALCLSLCAGVCAAASVRLGGIMGEDRALIAVDGGTPKLMRVGETRQGVRLVEVRPQSVLVEDSGQPREVRLGGGSAGGGGARDAGDGKAVLFANGQGHFLAQGQVNGRPVSFLLDTGASVVTIPRSVAEQAGVSLATAERAVMSTANGMVAANRVMLNSLQVGGITQHMVEAVVMDDRRLPYPLLGMSFLSRVDMSQEGSVLTLKKRY